MFYFFALPMTVGVEIARFLKIREVQPAAAVTQVSGALLLDRVLGAVSALAVALLCIPVIGPNVAIAVPGWAWLALVAVALVISIAAFAWSRSRSLVLDITRLAWAHWKGFAAVLLLSMAMHVVFAEAVQLLAAGLTLEVGFVETLFAVAGGVLLVAIPVSFAGVGPAEAGAAGLLMALGHPLAVALAVGALPYLARLIGALEGAVWEFVDGGLATLTATRRLFSHRQPPELESLCDVRPDREDNPGFW